MTTSALESWHAAIKGDAKKKTGGILKFHDWVQVVTARAKKHHDDCLGSYKEYDKSTRQKYFYQRHEAMERYLKSMETANKTNYDEKFNQIYNIWQKAGWNYDYESLKMPEED